MDLRAELIRYWKRLTQIKPPPAELARWWRTIIGQLEDLYVPLDTTATLRWCWVRMLWWTPRVRISVTTWMIGFLCLCTAIGIKLWGSETGTATGAVTDPAPLGRQTSSPLLTQRGARSGEPTFNAARTSSPPPPRMEVNELAVRKAALDRAREQCLERLSTNPDYQRAKAEFDRIDAKVKALRSQDPFRELPRVSVDWIQAKSDLQVIIDQAMNKDEQVRAAQEAYARYK